MEKLIKKAEKGMKSSFETIGPTAYFVGIVVAILAGFAMVPEVASITFLAAAGVIVGVLNIDDKEIKEFLLGSLTFLFCAVSLSNITYIIPYIGDQVRWTLYYLTAFAAPAAAVVALKAIHDAGKQ